MTADSILTGHIFTVSACNEGFDSTGFGCTSFDMTYSDHDGAWTSDEPEVNHVRTVEIILDSGADGSALPLEYAEAGVAMTPDDKLRFVDAQGSPLSISSTRLATVDFGDFALKEEFIVASITSPLLSLGKLMKHGWNLQKLGNELHLVKGNKSVPVSFKRNSLCISGNIRMLGSSTDMHMRAVQLKESLQRVRTTWTKLTNDCFAIKTYKPMCVDVTLAPASSLLWYRTTLVKRHGKWQLHQHNLFVTEGCLAKSLTTTLPDPNSVQEVITIGHTCECTHEQLGFAVVDEPLDLLGPLLGSGTGSSSSQPMVVVDQPAVEQKDDDMEAVAQPPVTGPAPAAFEAPIAPDEPAQPDDVAAGPEEIVLDGTRIDSSSSLTVLKAACSSLGVSTHGSRATAFQAFGAALTTARASGSALSETQLVQRPTATSQPAWNSK